MGENREKDIFSDPSTTLVSLNGVQVWADNNFNEEVLEENLHSSFEDQTAIQANESQKKKTNN